MVSPTKQPSKQDLILHSNNEQNYIEVSSHHTLSDVRILIHQELDIEQLPDEQFSFKLKDIRISEKQELKKLAFDLIERSVKVELVPKRGMKRSLDEDGVDQGEIKRVKSGESGSV